MKSRIELWRDLTYKGRKTSYKVNTKGVVKNFRTGKIVKQFDGGNGYLHVSLAVGTKGFSKNVHRMVAELFPDLVHWTEDAKGKPFEELDVNYKDENKYNNCVDNLEWCTRKYNINYGSCLEKRSKSRINKGNGKSILQYTLDMVFVAEYPSAAEAERQTGIFNTAILQCCKGRYKQAGGYIWKYKD